MVPGPGQGLAISLAQDFSDLRDPLQVLRRSSRSFAGPQTVFEILCRTSVVFEIRCRSSDGLWDPLQGLRRGSPSWSGRRLSNGKSRPSRWCR
ncbi:hypothetical protein Y1Q_0020474 [Alligator mississippiensis]|uniref:Uncharacterized protein n=1 Tax=Alligator mississippiensis TaxID=8496 RepID=A0A151NVF5_ALLMI|nr:hypothetical protein Y1Q_0020474 [Alligator mississippiensis]